MQNLLPYPPTKTTPWKHQEKAWELSQQFYGYYLAMDMGTGKSKCAVDYCNGFNAKLVLIICPKSVVSVWPKEFQVHSYTNYQIIGADFKKTMTIRKKALEIKNALQRNIMAGLPTALILNYDAIYRPPIGPEKNKKRRIVDVGLLLKHQWDVVIVDEAHNIKSPSGQASWVCKHLNKKSKRRLFLSGTPMSHSPVDIYAQFRSLDPSIFGTSFTKFKDDYCIMGGFENRQIVAYRNERQLHNKFHSRAYVVSKRDVIDLPKVTHVKRYIDLPDKLKRKYTELATDFIAGFNNGEISVDNALVKLLRLAQLTSGIAQYDDGTCEVIDDTKAKELEDIASSLKIDEPLVIFCRFRKELDIIGKLMTDMGRTTGELSGRRNDLAEFQEGKIDSLVVQIQAGNAGISLTRAAYCVYFSKGFSLGDYLQSEARLDRPGQTRPVTYYHINANSTVDVQIDRALEKRKIVVDSILNDVNGLLAAKAFMAKARNRMAA